MPPSKISIDEAKPNKLFYFVANVIAVRREDMRCLILKRDPREKVHAGKYGVMGGKLEWEDLDVAHPTRMNGDVLDFEDAVEKLLVREAREEAGIEIKRDIRYLDSTAFVRPDGVPVVLVKFAAEYAGGEVVLEKGGFTDYAWVNAEEAKNYPYIKGIPQEVAAAVNVFSK